MGDQEHTDVQVMWEALGPLKNPLDRFGRETGCLWFYTWHCDTRLRQWAAATTPAQREAVLHAVQGDVQRWTSAVRMQDEIARQVESLRAEWRRLDTTTATLAEQVR